MSLKPPKKKAFIFDWETLDEEVFRGKDLTFPIAATVMLVPEFDELVISAMDTFPHYGLVDPSDIDIHILWPWERGDTGTKPFSEMEGNHLGLRLHYIEGDHMDYVLRLRTEDTKRREG